MNAMKVTNNSFAGVPTAEPLRDEKLILATATGTITFLYSEPAYVPTEAVGTGDAVITAFSLANTNISNGSENIYVNGVLQVKDTDYTIVNATGVITFIVAPAAVPITADYTYSNNTSVDVLMVDGNFIQESSSICTGVTSATSVLLT